MANKKEAKKELNEDLLDSLSDEELEALAKELENDDDSSVEEVKEDSADGTGGTEGNFKSNIMSIAMKKMAGMSPDQMAIFMQSLDQAEHIADVIPSDASAKNQASIAMKGAISEDLALVFGGDKELSEEFKEKLSVIFESTVNARVAIIEQEIQEKFDAELAEQIQAVSEVLTEQVDEYLMYVAEEWIKENEVAIQKSLRTEIAEDFMEGLRDLFKRCDLNIPDEKLDLVDAMSTKVDELEAALNEQIEKNMELSKTIKSTDKDKVVSEMVTDLTLSQTEKFKQLIETIDYDGDVEAFKKKLEIVKDSHFKSTTGKAPTTNLIQEEITYTPGQIEEEKKERTLDPAMKGYVNALSKTIRH